MINMTLNSVIKNNHLNSILTIDSLIEIYILGIDKIITNVNTHVHASTFPILCQNKF